MQDYKWNKSGHNYKSFADKENKFLGHSFAFTMKEQEIDVQHMSAQVAPRQAWGVYDTLHKSQGVLKLI